MSSNLNVSEAIALVSLIVMIIVDWLILCLESNNTVLDLDGLTTNLRIFNQVMVSVAHFIAYFPSIPSI